MISNALVKLFFLNLNFFLFFLSPPSFSMSKAFPPFRFVLVHFSCVCKTWYVFSFVYFPTSLFLGPEPGAVMFAFRRRVHAGRKTCVLAGIAFVTWGSLDTPCLVLGWVVRIRGVGEQCPSLNAFPKQKTKTFPKTLRLYFIFFIRSLVASGGSTISQVCFCLCLCLCLWLWLCLCLCLYLCLCLCLFLCLCFGYPLCLCIRLCLSL